MNDCPDREALLRRITELEEEVRRLKRLSGADSEKHHQVLQNIQEGYYELDLKGNILAFNEAALALMGYAPHELVGMNFRNYTSPATAHRMFKVFHHIYRTGDPGRMVDYDVIHKDGSVKIHELSAGLMRDPEGMAVGFQVIFHDVTACKQAENRLKKSEERFSTILDAMGEAYFECDLDGNFTYVNEAQCRIVGYARDQLLTMNHRECAAAETAKRAFEVFNAIYRTGAQQSIPDHEVLRKDGKKIIVELRASLLHGENGEAIGFRGLARDVTRRITAERALQDNERKYRLLAENLRDVICVLDAALKPVYVSPSVKQLRGYTPEEAVRQTLDQVLAPASYHKAMAMFDKQWRALPAKSIPGKDWQINLDLEMVCKDGTTVWTEVTLNILFDDEGRPKGLLGIVHDISDRKAAEAALRDSEERYRTIFEHTATANIIVAGDTTILLANSNFERITGYARADVENKMSWTDFVVAEDLARMQQRHMQRRRDPGSVAGSYEFRGRIRSGEVRDFFMSVAMIPETSESVASLIDITDRNKAQQDLRQSEERFRDLARLLPETVFETNADGQLTFVNEISFERFGYTPADMDTGIHILDVLAPESHEKAVTNHGRVMAGERLGLVEYTALKKDGTRFPVLIHSTPISRDGVQSGLRGFLIDISEKKQLEAQLMRSEKLEAIGTLAGGMAHDFNNLLMGLLGNITLMLTELDASHPFHDRLKNMETYVQHGADLTRQLLGFARGGKYEVQPTDLGAFVAKSAELFGRTKKEIRMHCKVEESLWPAEVDRGQLEQVMLNLFINAWQAMPGGGDLYLSVENATLDRQEAGPCDTPGGRFVKITVTDTGVGMAEETKARIFEPFFSTKPRGRGTGLGLASAYGIVKNHGGFVVVESETAVGTTFMVYLPASTRSVEQVCQVTDPVQNGKETVLLIDDEQMILDVGSDMLAGLGYKVFTAAGGRQGIDVFDQNKAAIDLVILDMIMPDGGGRDTFVALRRSAPDVKVLLSSGYSIDGQAEEILAQGCKGFIQKPFSMAALSQKVRQAIGES
ncbi:PAS domain S-box protein [Desulfatitalea alkaliphila]|uniref:histidine kinase n=1 Tax=Desulfatitalea alkaliphila TaxID=2929485 RepID=A0AA41R1J0_9BACT|nr:PAS domain S-box protein [Desulfatitalea alkaliphila]MCJ8500334.1 PAS domain S-box protein [Desulfatitalea alkaliphila]